MTALTLALTNQKGGVGKTTTTFHMARAAVRAGRRVLVVDADPQGNLTSVITAEPVQDDDQGLADALSNYSTATLAEVIVPGVWDGLDVVPTVGVNLGVVRDELVVAGAGRESRLLGDLQKVRDNYDLILVDCAPSIDQLMINCLTAADGAVVVAHTKLFSANGLAALLDSIDGVRQHYNRDLRVAGVLVNQHEESTISGREWAAELREATATRGLPLLTPPIPKRTVISDALESATGLDEWPGRDRQAAQALSDLYKAHLATIEGNLR